LIEHVAQQLRTLDDELAVDLPDDLANRRHERHRIGRSSHVQRDARLIVLREEDIEEWRGVALQRADIDGIRHHADHMEWIGAAPERLADRILVRP
jgi:hypothetical protein